VLQEVCMVASRHHFEDATSHRCRKNYDHHIYHRTGSWLLSILC
jgi:hypothetical protein